MRLEGERRRPVTRQGNLNYFPEKTTARKGPTTERPGTELCLAVNIPEAKERRVDPAKTMEEVASYEKLKEAFKQVALNKGAPGPDGKRIEEIRVSFGEIVPRLHKELLDESYRVGKIRRVWMPTFRPDISRE
jgi:retron-type reverse transcriptase